MNKQFIPEEARTGKSLIMGDNGRRQGLGEGATGEGRGANGRKVNKMFPRVLCRCLSKGSIRLQRDEENGATKGWDISYVWGTSAI